MSPYDIEDYNDTTAGLLALRPGDALPWHVAGQSGLSLGAQKAVRDCTRLGLCSQQRRLVDGLVVFVAVRTAKQVLQLEEISA